MLNTSSRKDIEDLREEIFQFESSGIYFVNKKAPVKVEGNLMFTQRDNPYCDLLRDKYN